MSAMVSTQRKTLNKRNRFHQPENLLPLAGIKDFVKVHYPVFWKLCFDQIYFWLVETIIGIRGKQFSKKELIFYLVETVLLGQCYFAANRNHYWNKEKTVLRERAHYCQWTTDLPASGKHFFFASFFRDSCQFFFVQWESIFQGYPYFRVVETDFRANNGVHKQKKAVNKIILFPIVRNSDSTSQKE